MSSGAGAQAVTATATGRMHAREIALWATTTCDRARGLGDSGLSGRAALETLNRNDNTTWEPMGDSPRLAASAGAQFERTLFSNDAEVLRQLLVDAHGAAFASAPLVTFGDAKDPAEEAAVIAETAAVLRTADGPLIVRHAALELHVGRVTHLLRPDMLVFDGAIWTVGEMKSYVDRGGYTPPVEIGGAVAQAAVAAAALIAAGFATSTTVDIVLRQRSRRGASLRAMPAAAELNAVLAAARHADPARWDSETGGALDTAQRLLLIPDAFAPTCERSCGLASFCSAHAATATPAGDMTWLSAAHAAGH